jgi:hypothetical protein
LELQLDIIGKYAGAFRRFPRKICLQYDQGGMPTFKYTMELIKKWNPEIVVADGELNERDLFGYHVPCLLEHEEYNGKPSCKFFVEIVDSFAGEIPPRNTDVGLPF